MSGIESFLASAAGRSALAAARRFARTSEFERLCVRLAERFGAQTGWSATEFQSWAGSDAFMAALGKLIQPPHEFDRDALVAAITPLVGPLDASTPAAVFAEMLSEAIHDEIRFAKEGDSLLRFEADAIRQLVESVQAPVLAGGVDLSWAPMRAQKRLQSLAETDVASVQRLEQSLGGRDLRAELPGLVGDPPAWLRDGSEALWRIVAFLAEIVGCWREARIAHEKAADLPGADRPRELSAAATAAE
jgi:hypothetical protein